MKRIIQPVQVYVSSVIDAPIDQIWALVRDFNELPKWHPAILESRIEGDRESTAIGCIRNFSVKGGGKIRERLLELSDANYRFAYSIIESDFGLLDYVAEFALSSVTDGDRTFAAWSANFRTEAGLEKDKLKLVGDEVFLAGLEAIKRRLDRK